MIARTQNHSSGKGEKKLDTHLGPLQFVYKVQRVEEDAADCLLYLNLAEASLCWFNNQHLFQELPQPQHYWTVTFREATITVFPIHKVGFAVVDLLKSVK